MTPKEFFEFNVERHKSSFMRGWSSKTLFTCFWLEINHVANLINGNKRGDFQTPETFAEFIRDLGYELSDVLSYRFLFQDALNKEQNRDAGLCVADFRFMPEFINDYLRKSICCPENAHLLSNSLLHEAENKNRIEVIFRHCVEIAFAFDIDLEEACKTKFNLISKERNYELLIP